MDTLNKKPIVGVVITAGGISSRFGTNKLLENIEVQTTDGLKKTSVICAAAEKFLPYTDEIVIPCHNDIQEHVKNHIMPEFHAKIKFVQFGKTRQQSIFNGLLEFEKSSNTPDIVLIHDGARPFVTPEIITKTIETLKTKSAVCVGVYSTDTIKITDKEGNILKTIDRNTVFQAQTPQAFNFNTILEAHKKLQDKNFTDDSSMLEFLNIPVFALEGTVTNKKITFKEDLL